MSLISSSQQTGYFGGSLRAMEALIVLPALVAGVALPLLSAAARDDHDRLRYAIEGLGEGAVIAGVFVVLVTVRAAEPVMEAIGGTDFGPAGDVLRIQVIALLFIALYQIWTVSLIALGRQHELILTNGLALVGVGISAAALVPPLGARGGAIASVLGDALLASLIFWRLRRSIGIVVRVDFVWRVLVTAAVSALFLAVPGLPDLVTAVLMGATFVVVGHLIHMVPPEVLDAIPSALVWERRPVRARHGRPVD
jgi:O-antigen/teichoic acid export membrane protein